MYMNKDVMVEWVTNQFDLRLYPMEDRNNKHFQSIEDRIDQIVDENLKVPGLFGKPSPDGSDPKYDSLGDCLQSITREVKQAVQTLKIQMENKIDKVVQKVDNMLSDEIKSIQNH